MKKKLMIGFLSIVLLLLFGLFPTVRAVAAKVSLSSEEMIVTKGSTQTLEAVNTKETVKWTVLSGKNYITLKENGTAAATIKGRKKGTAKVQATVGTKKFTCTVVVKNRNEQDVAALKKLISKYKTVGQSLGHEDYVWEDGKLTEIHWFNKNLSGSLDFSECVHLKKLVCSCNSLDGLNVSQNKNLIRLYCNLTGLTDLDVSQNSKLTILDCSSQEDSDYPSGRLRNLNVSGCVNLRELNCSLNKLRTLDVKDCVNLEKLDCSKNKLTNLDVSGNAKLKTLHCVIGPLCNLDVGGCTSLTELSCYGSMLTNLDVSCCVNLKHLSCDNTVRVTGYNQLNE